MITAIVIENFKGIRERVRLGLKPITLLFGPNSAGKSTILHAIHYAREVLERHNLDAERTASGGQFVDLGGFGNFVHGRDRRRAVVLRFELDLRGQTFPEYLPLTEFADGSMWPISGFESEQGAGFAYAPKTGWVEMSIRWSEQGLFVESYSVGVDAKLVGTILCHSKGDVPLLDLNYGHPLFLAAQWELKPDEGITLLDDLYTGNLWPSRGTADCVSREDRDQLCIGYQADAQPRWDRALEFIPPFPGLLEQREPLYIFTAVVSRVMVGVGQMLRDALRNFRYVGPLRETPSRNYEPPRFPDPTRWINGLGAWDALARAGESGDLAQRVSDWLYRKDRLATGYAVWVRDYKELRVSGNLRDSIEDGHASSKEMQELVRIAPVISRVYLQKVKGESQVEAVFSDAEGPPPVVKFPDVSYAPSETDVPYDLGVGMSQLMPVVVAALDEHAGLTGIEQPELHLHPKIQCALGDLFVAGALSGKHRRNFIIETHSEHLVLRILRRIRETTRGEPHEGIRVTPDDVAVWYVSQVDGQSVPMTIGVDEHGEFTVPWPDDFFEQDFYERFA